MASPKKKSREEEQLIPPIPEKETLLKMLSVFFFICGIVALYALFGEGGTLGNELFEITRTYTGIGALLVPFIFFGTAFYLWKVRVPAISIQTYALGFTSLLSLLVLASTFPIDTSKTGGVFGHQTMSYIQNLVGHVPGIILVATIFVASTFVLFEGTFLASLARRISMFFVGLVQKVQGYTESVREKRKLANETESSAEDQDEGTEEAESSDEYDDEEVEPAPRKEPSLRDTMLGKEEIEKVREARQISHTQKQQDIRQADTKVQETKKFVPITPFTPPPLSLLDKDKGKAANGDIRQNAAMIKRTLQNFGITVEMDEISIGPSVTRYALKPAQGVKLSRIVGLQNELALDLAVESIRVEAPIPGKSLVGIEIPNESKSMVGLGSLLSHDDFQKSPHPLTVALGKGISGKPLFANLAKMPHLLIAGTTGSGKSVTMHAIIQSLLFRNSPYDLKLIMVDPKKVELTFYNNIPHLYTPVITTAKKTIQTLNWAVQEMERRYDLLEKFHEQDIKAYHQKIYIPEMEKVARGKIPESEAPSKMPYIVIVIDELADIMMTYPKELEAAIVRLAQKSRAVGIHLILSTQRPEVKVITGLIKANVPSRIALKVASQIDSRTIIDSAGAEKLLGAGDMLFSSADSAKTERVQSAFISTDEIKRVVQHIKNAYREMVPDEIMISDSAPVNGQSISSGEFGDEGEGSQDDELYEQAREIVMSSGKGSTSYLQRRLKIGYSRAARLIDLLESNGVVGPQDGSKPRAVLERSGATPGFGVDDADTDEDE